MMPAPFVLLFVSLFALIGIAIRDGQTAYAIGYLLLTITTCGVLAAYLGDRDRG